jgi:hypothetical protein
MNTDHNSRNSDEDAFLTRVLRYQEKSLEPEELREFNNELRGNPEKLAEFTRICDTSRLIREATAPESGEDYVSRPRLQLLPTRARWIEHAAVAALVLICFILGVRLNQHGALENGEVAHPPTSEQAFGEGVARIEYTSDDARLVDAEKIQRKTGEALGRELLELEEGEVMILFRSGAEVRLTAPAALGIHSPMRCYLGFGQASVYAPDSARDFVITTDTMEVVDLGTRFELSVDRSTQEAQVAVSEGLVDLHLGNKGPNQKIQSLKAGQTAGVSSAGTLASLNGRPYQPKPAQRIDSHVLAHWKLDDVAPNGTVADDWKRQFTGIGHNLSGIAADGKVGKALELGPEGYVDVSEHLPSVLDYDVFTFTAWIRIRKPGEYVAPIFSISDGTIHQRMQLSTWNKALVFLWQNGAHLDVANAIAFKEWEPDRWYHVALVHNKSGVALYCDGERLGWFTRGKRLGSKPATLQSLQQPTQMRLGSVPAGYRAGINHVIPLYFSGGMDDVQLYSIALDEDAIRYIYDNPGREWSPEKSPRRQDR